MVSALERFHCSLRKNGENGGGGGNRFGRPSSRWKKFIFYTVSLIIKDRVDFFLIASIFFASSRCYPKIEAKTQQIFVSTILKQTACHMSRVLGNR